MAEGGLSCIGATVPSAFPRLAVGSPLASLLRPLRVDPLRGPAVLETLRAHRDLCASKHRVEVSDEALDAVATLSDRYLGAAYQPGMAIRLLHEAAARTNPELASRRDVKELDELIRGLDEGRRHAAASGDLGREAKLAARLARAEGQKAAHLRDASDAADLLGLDEMIRALDQEKLKSVANQDFEKALAARDRASELRGQKESILHRQKERVREILGDVVDWTTVAAIVAEHAGVEFRFIAHERAEAQQLLSLEAELKSAVIGQEDAIATVARVVRLGRSGLKTPERPAAVLLFVGPSGVGKTYLASRLANALFGHSALREVDLARFPDEPRPGHIVRLLAGPSAGAAPPNAPQGRRPGPSRSGIPRVLERSPRAFRAGPIDGRPRPFA